MAAARLATARTLVNAFAEEHNVPVENLLTPDYLRRVLWKPPERDASASESDLEQRRGRGARAPRCALLAGRDHGTVDHPGDPAAGADQRELSHRRAPLRDVAEGLADGLGDGPTDGLAFEGSKRETEASSIASRRSCSGRMTGS